MEGYFSLAANLGIPIAHLALRFCETRPFTTSVILGATSLAQLKEIFPATELPWTPELEKSVNLLHQMQPNPCP